MTLSTATQPSTPKGDTAGATLSGRGVCGQCVADVPHQRGSCSVKGALFGGPAHGMLASKMELSRRCFLVGGMSALVAAKTAEKGEDAELASAFTNSVGINTHLSSANYAHRFEALARLMGACRIKYLRDEVRPTNNLRSWQELYERYGIRSHLLVSPSTNTIPEMLRYISALGVEKICAIEGQNEGDSPWFMAQEAARGDWSTTVIAYQRDVYRALRDRYPADALPIVSPTVLDWKPGDAALLRGAAPFCDIVAIHSYAQHGQMPETGDSYAAVSWYLQNMRDSFKPGAPVMATETGYNTMVRPKGAAVSEMAAAIYIPRLLLNNFAMGIERTFLYDFIDDGEDKSEWENNWGLVRFDGTPKPSYHAVAALLHAFGDEPSSVAKSETQLAAKLEEAPDDAQLLQFKRADGASLLAVWRAVPCWHPGNLSDIDVTPEPVIIRLDRPVTNAELMVPNDGGTWEEIRRDGSSVRVPVGPKVVLVRLGSH